MHRHVFVRAGLSAAVALAALAVPAASSASATPSPVDTRVSIAADSIDAKCRSHSRDYVVRDYFRGAQEVHAALRHQDGGWKHIKLRHGWNSTMDRKISAAISSGADNGRGGYSTYTIQCPPVEKFRTIIGTPGGINDLLTAYRVDQRAAAAGRC
ncbi:hypothetical protein AB0N62_08080 [Streptomyces sp. NPDC093982]|uniref:hypothetical protein n=1 Tax=Streptomyces sp. NPDC093982 TaxID=3155077 RepID=UPI003420F362